ncbi:MAG: GerMN domain-containing protein [Candidatus Avilachnospira sp.]|jgi:hypothetical protein
MRRLFLAVVLTAAAMSFSACTPSNIQVQTEEAPSEMEEQSSTEEALQETEEPETEAVTFAEGEVPTGVNGGPGLLPTTTADQSDLPPDKRNTSAEEAQEIVSVYCVDSTGVFQQMDVVEEITADTLMERLIINGVLSEDTEIVNFTDNGDGTAVLELSELTPVYKKAKEEQVLACITDTFTENLGLTQLEIKAGGKDYGSFEFTDEYDRT